MSKGQFYQTTNDRGQKVIFNVNNVALMRPDTFGTKVTLNVKDEKDNFIEFISNENFMSISNNVTAIDEEQFRNMGQYNQD